MVDISLCLGFKDNEAYSCPLKDKCYRYQAKSLDLYQVYAFFSYNDEEGCKFFIPIGEEYESSY